MNDPKSGLSNLLVTCSQGKNTSVDSSVVDAMSALITW